MIRRQFDLLRQWFADRRIRTKIMLIYFPLLLLPLFILGYTANAVYSNAIIAKTTESFADNSALIINRVSGMLGNAESSANMLALNLNRVLDEFPLSTAENSRTNLNRYNAISTQLSLALVVFPEVESIVFADRNGQLYGSNPLLEQKAELALASPEYARIMGTNGINEWLPMATRTYLTIDADKPVLTLGKKISDITSGELLGLLFLNVREDMLSSVMAAMQSEGASRLFIADAQGRIVSTPVKEELLQPPSSGALRSWVNAHVQAAEIQWLNDERTLLASRGFPRLGWKLVSVTPLRSITDGLEQLQWTIVAIAALCSLLALLGATYLSKRIARPIVELARSMKGFQQGDLDVRLQVRSRDELGFFSLGFNEMTRRIRELLHNVKEEQRQKREYELALIQAQIKPHFLYNTLDVIYALSEMGRSKDVQRTTKALADFYRVTLSRGREVITIEEELRNVKDYLAIQHIRYADVFTYELEIDKAILKAPILKLTLQPLVENAIYHGLKEQDEMGHLIIRGTREGDRIVLQVMDNGTGINPKRLPQLLHADGTGVEGQGGQEQTNRQEHRGSYGLRNVNERIKLSYGPRYGLQLESTPGKGTTVTVWLPAGEADAGEADAEAVLAEEAGRSAGAGEAQRERGREA